MRISDWSSDVCSSDLALEALTREPGRSLVMNCGYGRGFSVREVLDEVDRVTGRRIERRQQLRRAGAPASLVADTGLIGQTLPWQPGRQSVVEGKSGSVSGVHGGSRIIKKKKK